MIGRTLSAVLAGVAVISFAAGAAAQQPDDYPNRPIRIIVPQAAGSGVDLQARVLAQKMGEFWGHQGIVDNRPGANAIIGMEAAAKAQPDGYTLVYAPVSAVTTNAFIYKKLPYDALRDFAPITQTTATAPAIGSSGLPEPLGDDHSAHVVKLRREVDGHERPDRRYNPIAVHVHAVLVGPALGQTDSDLPVRPASGFD